MIIASQKRKENIAEYLLYMWQIEDLIRANNLDIDKIRQNIIDSYPIDDATKEQMAQWYESLIDMMRREEVTTAGHLQINKNTLGQLIALHNEVLAESRFEDYRAEFLKTLPFIVELRSKAGTNPAGEVETCFNALYGVMLLRMRRQEISEYTAKALGQISRFVSMLATYFHLDEADKLFNQPDNKN